MSLSSMLCYQQRKTKIVSLWVFRLEAGLSSVGSTVLVADKLPHLGAVADLLAGLGVRHCYFLSSFSLPSAARELGRTPGQLCVRLAGGYSFLFSEQDNVVMTSN